MRTNRLLWVVQALLAALFLFAGAMKLILPLGALKGPIALPGPFLRFIGTAEVLGAIGLVVPWLTGIQRVLTPLAAVGLVAIMTGAASLTALAMGIGPALFPLAVGALASVVAVSRGRGLTVSDQALSPAIGPNRATV